MLDSTPGAYQTGEYGTRAWPHVQSHRGWRILLWTGLLSGVLLLAWHVTTAGTLRAADGMAKPVAKAALDTVALNSAWQFVDESKPGSPPTYGVLAVATSAPAPVAARFHISSSMQALALQLSEGDLGGVPLAQVEELDYCTRSVDGPRPYAVTLQINVDADVADDDQSWQGRLVYTPSYNGAVIQGEWQCWNTLVGKWWATGGPVAEIAPVDDPLPLGTLLAHFPNLGVNATYSVVALKAGDGWRDFLGEASPVAISVEGERYDVAFGAVPESNEVLLPVLFSAPPVTTQNEASGQGDNGSGNNGQGNNKDKNQGKDKPAKENPGKNKPDNEKQNNEKPNNEKPNNEKSDKDNKGRWSDVDWGAVDWNKLDWEQVNWDDVQWDEIDWKHFGWRAEVIREFVDDVKVCKKQGWQEAGFRNQGQCVAYYVSAHSPVYLAWNRGWNSEGWERDWGANRGDDNRDDGDRDRGGRRNNRDDD